MIVKLEKHQLQLTKLDQTSTLLEEKLSESALMFDDKLKQIDASTEQKIAVLKADFSSKIVEYELENIALKENVFFYFSVLIGIIFLTILIVLIGYFKLKVSHSKITHYAEGKGAVEPSKDQVRANENYLSSIRNIEESIADLSKKLVIIIEKEKFSELEDPIENLEIVNNRDKQIQEKKELRRKEKKRNKQLQEKKELRRKEKKRKRQIQEKKELRRKEKKRKKQIQEKKELRHKEKKRKKSKK